MMIAIMGDVFDEQTENKENNRKLVQFRIMIEYINLTVLDGDKHKPKEYQAEDSDSENENNRELQESDDDNDD